MTNITRVIKDLIEANTYAEITANVGNTEPVTVDSIVYADQTWANTSNTSVTSAGGYIKLYGKGFETNANVLFGSTVATANVQSANEVRVNVPALSTGTYTMFLYNPSGSNAIKYKSIPVQGDYNYGWFTGGQSGTSIISSVERINFSNDTVNTDIRATLPRNTVFASSAGTKDNGYIIGGAESSASFSPTLNSQVFRITYANDETSALARAPITDQRWTSSTSSKNYGYTSGGVFSNVSPGNSLYAQGSVSTTNRMDFANDNNAFVAKGPLSIARMRSSSASNDSYGWYIGGSSAAYGYNVSPTPAYNAVIYSIVDRLNFNSDTTTMIVRGPLSTQTSFAASSSNDDYSWTVGGTKVFTYNISQSPQFQASAETGVQRMIFSSDNVSMVTRSTGASSLFSGTSSSGDKNYGWFSGGVEIVPVTGTEISGVATTNSNIYRLTYASDTTALNNRSSFFQARKFHTGNSGVVS